MIPHNRLIHGTNELAAVAEVVASGHWAAGPRVAELEAALSIAAGSRFAACVASGSAALELALASLGVSDGDEVLIPAYCCSALPNAVLARRATPIAVEVLDGEWTIDPDAARVARSPRTRAVIAIHTFGVPAQIAELRRLGLSIIEDCSHAFGPVGGAPPLGSLGDIAILSLFATKLIGGGEGGALLCNDASHDAFVREWRDYRDQPAGTARRAHTMTDVEAALALCQLRRLPSLIESRARLAREYDARLQDAAMQHDCMRLPSPESPRIWYRYALELTDRDVNSIRAALRAAGVAAESPFADWRRDPRSEFSSRSRSHATPHADRAFSRLVSLPLFPSLRLEELETVCTALRAALVPEPIHVG